MSAPGARTAKTPLGTSLTEALDQLQQANRLGQDRLPEEDLERLQATLDRTGSRRSLSAEHTVVGVFGPTGSGKSSLVNALSGTEAARVAARRPTTSEPLALVWGRTGSDELLDWLQVRQRVELPDGAPLIAGVGPEAGHVLTSAAPAGSRQGNAQAAPAGQVREGLRNGYSGSTAPANEDGSTADGSPEDDSSSAGTAGSSAPDGPKSRGWAWGRGLFRRRRRASAPAAPKRAGESGPGPSSSPDAGLILLDLPDFDSTALAHRQVVERLTGQVDVLLWVVDPQKYADAALHHGFLRGLAAHESVTLVALSQADRLAPHDLEAVTSSLAGILADEGLRNIAVMPVSARTGQGVGDLAEAIRELAESRAAATRRMVADAERAADVLLPFAVGRSLAPPSEAAMAALSDELGAAAGVPVVVDAVRRAYRRDAHATTGWPVTRWLGGLRPDPLRRLNLRHEDVVPELRRSSLPVAQPAQQARVDHALRVFGDAAAHGAVEPWHSSIRDAARGTAEDLTDALDTAVTGTDLETGRKWWWGIFAVLQWVAFTALVVGLAWLGVLAVLGFLQLPAIDVPRVEGFPVPTLLILGGATAGILLAVVAAVLARWDAGRRASRVRRRLLASCSRVAHEVVLQPVEDEVSRCNDFSAAVRAAARRT